MNKNHITPQTAGTECCWCGDPIEDALSAARVLFQRVADEGSRLIATRPRRRWRSPGVPTAAGTSTRSCAEASNPSVTGPTTDTLARFDGRSKSRPPASTIATGAEWEVDRNREGSDICHRFGSRSTPPRRVRRSRRNRSRLSDADRQPRSDDERSAGNPPGRQRPLGRWAIMPVDRCLAGVAGNRRVLQIYFPDITNRCCDCRRGCVEYGYRSLAPAAAGVELPQPARRPGRPEPDSDVFPGGATDDRPEPLLGPDDSGCCGQR